MEMTTETINEFASLSLVDILGYLQGYVLLVIICVGVVGNVITLVIFFRANRGNDPTVQYFTCITIGDTAVLLFLAVPDWLRYGMPFVIGPTFNLFGTANIACKLFVFCVYTSATFSSLCLASFTMERALFVWFPFKRSLLSGRNRKYVIAAIMLVSLVTNIHIAIYFENFTGAAGSSILYCFYRNIIVDFLTDNLRYVVIPCFVIMVCNTLIVIGIVRSKKSQNTLTVGDQSKSSTGVLINLFLVSVFYVIFNVPRITIWTYHNMLNSRKESMDPSYMEMLFYVSKFCEFFWLFNFCTNFIIYGVSLPFYRKEIASLCCYSNRK